jgi:hypothetical protein
MEHPVLTTQSVVADDAREGHTQVTYASDGVKWYQLKPPDVAGQTLLERIFAQRQIISKTQEKELYAPNDYLDIARKLCNVTILNHMTAPDLSKRPVIQDCASNGVMLILVTRKLYQTG